MFVENAAIETLDFARMYVYQSIGFEQSGVDYEYLADLVKKIRSDIPYEEKCRWLGYIQGVLVAMCDQFTPETVEEINKRNVRYASNH